MSPSDASRAGRFVKLVEALADIEYELKQVPWPDAMELEACSHLLGMASRFYVAAVDAKPEDMPFPALGLTPTDSVVVAAATLRDQDLTPFDLTLWFQRAIYAATKSNYFTESTERRQPVLGSSQS